MTDNAPNQVLMDQDNSAENLAKHDYVEYYQKIAIPETNHIPGYIGADIMEIMLNSANEIGAIFTGVDVEKEPQLHGGEKTRTLTYSFIVPKENLENEEALRAKADVIRAERRKAWMEGK